MSVELSVVVPVYNGAGFIAGSVEALRGYLAPRCPSFEILVVDDGSTDGTRAILAGLEDDVVRVLSLSSNLGKFGALATGMRAARGRCRVFTDADLPYELEAIPYIASIVNERQLHVVVGDRTLFESQYSLDLPVLRRIATRMFTLFVTIFVTGGLFDTQCGLKGLRGDVADALFPLLKNTGFAGDVELLYIALKYNLEIKRIPVRLRRSAPSTVRLVRDAIGMVRCIVRLRASWRRGLYFSPALRALARQAYWQDSAATPASDERAADADARL